MTDRTSAGNERGEPALPLPDSQAEHSYASASASNLDATVSELFREHAEFVWRVVRRLGVPDSDAEDAVQEVFVVVARRLETYSDRSALRAWLVAIARQVALHERRGRFRRERKAQALPAPDEAPDPQRLLETKRSFDVVNQFLASLDPDQALVFYLAEIEGMTVPEVAASLHININTAYGRLRLARQRFERQARAVR